MKSIPRHLIVIALCCTVQPTVAGNELPNVANRAASTSVAGLLDDLKKARATFAETDSRCGNVLLQTMDWAIAGVGNDPSLSTKERLSIAVALGVERQNFVDRGMLPFSSRLRKASIAYVAEMRSAWAPWEAACNNLINYYTKAGDLKRATEYEGEKMNPLKVVAIWKAVGATHKPWNETLLCNGMRIGAKSELWGYWRMEGNQLFFEELDHKTFGAGTIADDGLSFKGRHGKYPLSGKLTVPATKLPNAPTVAVADSKPAAVFAAIQTDANQPRVEVLKDQAPNAVEWALAPLDQMVPGDIRQNLTFLREDLLDEGKQKPKASPAAYTLAAQICNTLLTAFEERNQTLAHAGFRAVEAQTRTGVTSDTLDARRNYKMSWPQFARENAQRAELKSQANNSAAVMAERPKLQWTERTVVLRKTLDGLYAQFREALRQSAGAK